jgi:hypothetical protein
VDRIRSEHVGLQRNLAALQMAEWVHGLAPWECIAHLTFRWEASFDSGRRGFEKFMAQRFPWMSYFYALEQNPGRLGCHVHALWSDTRNVYCREAWASWFDRYGRNKIELVRSKDDVASYCAKYVCKERAWWNVRLQWHRMPGHKLELEVNTS